MDNTLIEIEKRTLQAYYMRLLRGHEENKLEQFKFLWNFIHKSVLFSPIAEEMRSKNTQYWGWGNSIVYTPHQQLPDDHLDRINATYFALTILLKSPRSQFALHDLGRKYNPEKDLNNREKDFTILNDLFLEEFIFYFISQSDKNNITLGLLKKYKQRSEWFNGETLFRILTDHPRKAEKMLKRDLHLYLSDQGLDITVEPVSPGGEVDFIGLETNGLSKSVVEVKIFDAVNRNRTSIISGFHQLLTYLKDYDASKGYLIIYNSARESLVINTDSLISFPFIVSGNRTIYFVVIDIYPHELPASRRGNTGIAQMKESDF